ncbi:hypothetical protein FQZ97_1009880 [compost metagenome]
MRFAREVGVVRARDGAQLDALAEIVAAELLVAGALGVDRLARITGRVGVGDVVANDLQRRQVGGQRVGTDVEGRGHVSDSRSG